MKFAALVIVLSLIVSSSLADEPPVITIEQVKLQLGMDEDRAMALLSDMFTLKRALGLFAISTKVPPYQHVGYVRFEEGHLVGASKVWSVRQEKGVDIARALYGAVSAVAQPDSQCKVSTREKSEPHWTMKTVLINCGIRAVRLDFDASWGATVSEVLGKPDSPE